MRAEPTLNKGSRMRSLRTGFAAGMLVLTLGIAGATGDADCQPVNQGTQQKGVTPEALKQDTPVATSRVKKTLQWLQVGQASWYGLKFQGKKTASGESFDRNNLTCAHRTLPLGSWIRVTNLKNRRSIFVRVTDRGPMPENRVVDLSQAAARAVGISGIAKVKLESVRGGDQSMARDLIAQLQMPLMAIAGQ